MVIRQFDRRAHLQVALEAGGWIFARVHDGVLTHRRLRHEDCPVRDMIRSRRPWRSRPGPLSAHELPWENRA